MHRSAPAQQHQLREVIAWNASRTCPVSNSSSARLACFIPPIQPLRQQSGLTAQSASVPQPMRAGSQLATSQLARNLALVNDVPARVQRKCSSIPMTRQYGPWSLPDDAWSGHRRYRLTVSVWGTPLRHQARASAPPISSAGDERLATQRPAPLPHLRQDGARLTNIPRGGHTGCARERGLAICILAETARMITHAEAYKVHFQPQRNFQVTSGR
jgi:hypothetical protein